jgi:hypothetical protein
VLDSQNSNLNQPAPPPPFLTGSAALAEINRRREVVNTRTPAALVKAHETTQALLTPAWRFMLGESVIIVEAIIRRMLESREIYEHDGQHVFMTYDDLGLMVGRCRRTIERYLSPENPHAEFLRCWLSWRKVYGKREDGGKCRVGTVFRVTTRTRVESDHTPAPKPTLAALKAPWRLEHDLPQARASNEVFSLSDDNRQEKTGIITFPKSAECFLRTLRVEGEHLIQTLQGTLNFNSRHDQTPVARVDFSKAGVFNSQAWDRADMACQRLGDFHSKAYWYTQFRTAIEVGSDTHIWAAISQALEMQRLGMVTRASAAGYAVGVLRRAEGQARAIA